MCKQLSVKSFNLMTIIEKAKDNMHGLTKSTYMRYQNEFLIITRDRKAFFLIESQEMSSK